MKTTRTIKVSGKTFVVKQSGFRLSTSIYGLELSAMNLPELKEKIRYAIKNY